MKFAIFTIVLVATILCFEHGQAFRYRNIVRYGIFGNTTRKPLKDVFAEASKNGFWDKVNPVNLWNKIPFKDIGSSISDTWKKVFKRSTPSFQRRRGCRVHRRRRPTFRPRKRTTITTSTTVLPPTPELFR
ncbi:hypothetical protein HHI36_012112 [Cryptolaemus montrouzieri]|uniref:Uncharacterized protein n=1 Tax=Cryptolaemus montrouzieri TaxID=559131 RepID=A0ABD2NDI9_9CUCU